MEKRSILAIALSIMVLLLWSALMPKQQPAANKALTESAPIASPAVTLPVPVTPVSVAPAVEVQFQNPQFEISFDESLAAVRQVIFKQYLGHKFILENGFDILDINTPFKKESASVDGVTFVQFDATKKITKVFILSKMSNFEGELRINVQSQSSQPIKLDIPLILGTLDFAPANVQSRFQDVVAVSADKTAFLNGRKETKLDNIKFACLREKYFSLIVEPEEKDWQMFVRKLTPQRSQVGIVGQPITLLPGQSMERKFRIYLGPQDLQILNKVNPQWATIINYGFFDFIGQLLLHLLQFFFAIVHNWGWAIVILSIAVYLILYPLTLKQMRSMKEMQALQPRIEELRKSLKDNPQKLNKEIMELYKVHKVNPFGGCLPLLLQMPIFFALYQVLSRSIALKGAHFLWIKDLSEPDRLIMLPSSLPILGNEINILPILMAIVMFFQQKMSMTGAHGASADMAQQQQKIMLIIFPVMFGFIFYRMPSGLVLYWFINSGLMVASQFWTKKPVLQQTGSPQRAGNK
ncbi:MAG: membrane protein insertase YidC [Candidatus Omnitrophota bacterium]|nr:membrane protein insertase YidC [Candidatus Omnitrophota bacterium]